MAFVLRFVNCTTRTRRPMRDENSEPFGSSSDQVPEERKSFASPVIPLLLPGLKVTYSTDTTGSTLSWNRTGYYTCDALELWSGCSRFEFHLGFRLFWLICFTVFLSPIRRKPVQYPQTQYDRFLSFTHRSRSFSNFTRCRTTTAGPSGRAV